MWILLGRPMFPGLSPPCVATQLLLDGFKHRSETGLLFLKKPAHISPVFLGLVNHGRHLSFLSKRHRPSGSLFTIAHVHIVVCTAGTQPGYRLAGSPGASASGLPRVPSRS